MGQRTIEDHTDKFPGEICLLGLVLPEWDLGSVRIIGIGLFRKTRHCSEEEIATER